MKRYRKYGILFAALMAAALLCGSAFAEEAPAVEGKGTADEPYKVSTPKEFDKAIKTIKAKADESSQDCYITLSEDIELTKMHLQFDGGKQYVLDLNGNTIKKSSEEDGTCRNIFKLVNCASLTIKDSSAEAAGKIDGMDCSKNAILLGGSAKSALTLEGGTILGPVVVNVADCAVNINGGTVAGGTEDAGIVFNTGIAGDVNITGGTVKGDCGVAMSAGGSFKMTGGTLEGLFGPAFVFGSATKIEISGEAVLKGSITPAIIANPTATIETASISGGTFTGFAEGSGGTEPQALDFGTAWDKTKHAITGGTFNSKIDDPETPTNILDFDKVVLKDNGDGTYTVITVAGNASNVTAASDIAKSADAVEENVQKANMREEVEYSAADTGLSEENLEQNDAGYVTVAKAAAVELAKEEYGDDAITETDVRPLPVFKFTNVDPAKALMVNLGVCGKDLLEAKAKDVKLLKILSDTEAEALVWTDVVSGDMEGKFIITDDTRKFADDIDKTKQYVISVFIKDDGKYDLDKKPKQIVDPLALVGTAATPATPTTPTTPATPAAPAAGDDSSGCNAGFAGMLLLLALPLIAKRKD